MEDLKINKKLGDRELQTLKGLNLSEMLEIESIANYNRVTITYHAGTERYMYIVRQFLSKLHLNVFDFEEYDGELQRSTRRIGITLLLAKELTKKVNTLNDLNTFGASVWLMHDTIVNGHQYLILGGNNYILKQVCLTNHSIKFLCFEGEKTNAIVIPASESVKVDSMIRSYIARDIPDMRKGEELVVCRTFEFDSAHYLEGYKGKCANLHGGRYKLEVYVKGPIDLTTGMVMDFNFLKAVVNTLIVKQLDHKCVNLTVPPLKWRSTVELMLEWIWNQLEPYIPLWKLRLYETPNSFAELTRERRW